jgi:hypothetical protein
MKLLYLSIILLASHTYSILLNNKKICKDCKYFIGDTKKCQFFSETNLVTGEKTYKYAEIMRKYDDECGEDGKYFVINKIKFITVPYYFLKNNWMLILVSLSTCLYLYAYLALPISNK